MVLIGGPCTGKTTVATTLGIQGNVHDHRKDRFFWTIEFIN